jgi:NAD-dependent deacetylase
VYFDEFMTSRKKRQEYWQRWQDLYQGIVKAAPNPAHLSLARLHAMRLLEAVVTQNVDGLHQAAGVPPEKVIELHGNTRRIRCVHCRRIVPVKNVLQRLASGDPAPECEICGGYLKPDTISFGQAMPQDQVQTATTLACQCDLFIVVGSTLVVQPAAHLPVQAKDHGALLAIINLSQTPCDGMCDILIREKAGIVLPEVVQKVASL